MLLFLVAYLGGALTILSPCILPVLPFVFARANRSFLRSSLPLLAGMAVTFAAVATLAAVGGGWAVQANQAGRWAAIVLLAFFGLTLLLPRLADRAMQPLVRLGSRLSNKADQGGERIGSSLLLGVATGLLWAPCAGPILGLVLTGAALNGASTHTTVLLLAYALGAATSLGLALAAGGRLLKRMKRYLAADVWVRTRQDVAILSGRDPRPCALLGRRLRRSPRTWVSFDLAVIDRCEELDDIGCPHCPLQACAKANAAHRR